jgi:hypothetical protein
LLILNYPGSEFSLEQHGVNGTWAGTAGRRASRAFAAVPKKKKPRASGGTSHVSAILGRLGDRGDRGGRPARLKSWSLSIGERFTTKKSPAETGLEGLYFQRRVRVAARRVYIRPTPHAGRHGSRLRARKLGRRAVRRASSLSSTRQRQCSSNLTPPPAPQCST